MSDQFEPLAKNPSVPGTEWVVYPGEENDRQIRMAALDASARYHSGKNVGAYMVVADAALFARYIKTGETR